MSRFFSIFRGWVSFFDRWPNIARFRAEYRTFWMKWRREKQHGYEISAAHFWGPRLRPPEGGARLPGVAPEGSDYVEGYRNEATVTLCGVDRGFSARISDSEGAEEEV